ncbi:MAG: aminotransferase class III-fold pyridoxal phosphate-dependent enzyme, partial [Planctomycetota bacterium]
MRDPSDCLAEHQPARQAASPLLAQCSLRPHDPFADIAFQRATGSRMWDHQGDCWIDLTCGFSVSNFGHAH